MPALEISLTALVAVLLLLGEHWFPWEMIFHKKIPHLVAYIIGVLALVLPLTGLFIWWGMHPPAQPYAHLIALWAVIVSGGMAVIWAYGIDWLLDRIRRSFEQEDYF